MKPIKFIDLFPTGGLAGIALNIIIREYMARFFPDVEIETHFMNHTPPIEGLIGLSKNKRMEAITSQKIIGYTVTVTFRHGALVSELHFQSDRPIHPLEQALYRMVDYFVKIELGRTWKKLSNIGEKTESEGLAAKLITAVNNENDAIKKTQKNVG